MLWGLWEVTDLVGLRLAGLERSPDATPENQAPLGCWSREVSAETDLLEI